MSPLHKHPFYTIWQSMKRRCDTPSSKAYKHYGGRGIKVCPQWRDNFPMFVADMGNRPHGYTLERIDNDGDYTPENCRWASRKDQQRNQRRTRYASIEGITYKAVELANLSGWKTDTIMERASLGLTLEQVLSPKHRITISPDKWEKMRAGQIRRQQAQTHCAKGHEYTFENTRITKQGWRNCRACHRINASVYRMDMIAM